MTNPSANYGVYSEVGKLRKVLVCSPGLAHERLTPTNCDDLLFDDVLWVQNARRDHFDFIDKMRDRGVEVVELHDRAHRDDGGSRRRRPGCWTARSSPTRWASALSTTPAATWTRCSRGGSPSC